MATGGLHEEVVDLVDCALCCDRFDSDKKLPKSLPCLHTFCLECLINYYKTRTDLTVPCPNCKRKFTVPKEGLESLPTNLIVKNLLPRFLDGAGAKGSKGSMRVKFCDLHDDEKCTYFCDDCNIPLCSDCLLSQRCDRSHKIRKLKDVHASLDAQIKDMEGSFGRLHLEGKCKLERLRTDLVSAKDALLKETKDNYEDAILKAKKWYSDATATIENNFDDQCAKLSDMESRYDLEKFQMDMLDVATKKNEGLIVEVKSQLKQMEQNIEQLAVSSQRWAVSLGSISGEDALQNLRQFSLPRLTMPDVETVAGASSSSISQQIDIANDHAAPNSLSISLYKEHRLKSPCNWSVGLTLDEAVVCYDAQKIVQRLSLRSGVPLVIAEKELPDELTADCYKYSSMTNDGNVLLQSRKDLKNCFMLNKRLEEVRSIDSEFLYNNEEYVSCIRPVSVHSSQWVASKDDAPIRIADLKNKKELQVVNPPTNRHFSYYVSVSKHPHSSALVVVDADHKLLVIYDTKGKPVHTAELPFQPLDQHAVAVSCDFIYILSSCDSPAVYIYSWDGALRHVMDRRQLGLDDGHYLWNIHAEGQKVIVAGGQQTPSGRLQVEYFRTFTVVGEAM